MRTRPTLSDVAREAGVSLATASRAINGSPTRTVRADLRERVLEAAARLEYTPDANAQAMARGQTTSVGLVVHDVADPYFSTIAAGVTAAADDVGLAVTLAETRHDPRREVDLVELLHRQRARAIVLAGGRLGGADRAEELTRAIAGHRRSGGGVALIGQPLPEVPAVALDNSGGAAALARALHDAGHRRFGVIAGPADHLTARHRQAGFREALAELGTAAAPEHVVPSEFSRDGGYAGMTALLPHLGELDVVFAVTDLMAVGAMAAVRDAGLTVPTDVGVAGFDDIPTLRDITPGLTTVRVPLREIGAQALQLALALEQEPRVVVVRGEVVLRDSTARP
ncbi:LacI family DNA-binding transcriptional regulator [Beutenbergia cavernae]|uniref:LacI family DNA-binding transcriptional regulator n=1 Tax=Beutenbergia cavernae TaxID=84757 RepID=UPI001180DF48|nr:LacI family DNA-binding transcriptional regulator [Beutenbergia cavernae]